MTQQVNSKSLQIAETVLRMTGWKPAQENAGTPNFLKARHAVLPISNGYVVFDRVLGRIMNGVFYVLDDALDGAARYNESEDYHLGMLPNADALGLLFPEHGRLDRQEQNTKRRPKTFASAKEHMKLLQNGDAWTAKERAGHFCWDCKETTDNTVTLFYYNPKLDLTGDQAKQHTGWKTKKWLARFDCWDCGDHAYKVIGNAEALEYIVNLGPWS